MQIPHVVGDIRIDSGLGALRSEVQGHVHSWPDMNDMPIFDPRKYGSKGDGKTEDDGPIQEAIEAAKNKGGGTILIPDGVHILKHHLEMSSNYVHVRGLGMGSVLKLKNGANKDLIKITGTTTKRWSISNLRLDGNKANNSTGHGIHVASGGTTISGCQGPSRARIVNIMIEDAPQCGYYAPGEWLVSGMQAEIYLHLVEAIRSGVNGFCMGNGQTDYIMSLCVAASSGQHGFFVKGSNLQLSHCYSWYSGLVDTPYHGFADTGHFTRYVSCEAQENYGDGFYLACDGVNGHYVVSGCIAESNGMLAETPAYVGFNVKSDYGVITGCRAWDRKTPKTQTYGLSVGTGYANNLIMDNNFLYNLTGGINATTSLRAINLIKHNMGDDGIREVLDRIADWTATGAGLTPDVSGGSFFTSSPASTTDYANFINGMSGQIITILFFNGNATVKNNATIQLAGAVDWVPGIRDTLRLILWNGIWREISRSNN